MHRFLRFLMVMFCLVLGTTMAVAQPRNMKVKSEGTVIDSKTSEPLFAATVKATSADGGTGTFAITDTLGHFTLEFDRPGKYTLEFTYMGYKTITKDVQVFPGGRGAKLGKFRMSEDAHYLKEIETVGRNQRVKQVGDTIAYNADAYKVQDGAAAEDLIKKMPGMEVTSTGVKAQGETVEKILVDGKAFFENDPMLALKTLPAEVIQSVSVFDKKSDQAEFTGVDDGNTVKAMDIATKSYRRNGVFGKVYGSLGNNFDFNNMYWNAGFNLNFFDGDRRISLLGMSNNVNQQDFTFDDLEASGGMGGGFGGGFGMRRGAAGGVSRANALGLQFSNNYLDGKLDIQGSYFFNNVRTESRDSSYTDYIRRTQSSISNGNSVSHSYRHRFEMRINYVIDENNDLLMRPTANFQMSDSRSSNESSTWEQKLEDVMASPAIRSNRDMMTRWSDSQSESDNTSWNVGTSLLWRHKFAKAGRTLSVEGQISRSGSNSDSQSERYGSDIENKIAWGEKATNFQKRTGDQTNWRGGGNIQYTESLNDFNQLSLRYRLNYTNSENDTEVNYYENGRFQKVDSTDVLNSNHYSTTQIQHGGELMWRFYNDYVNLNVGANMQGSILEGEQIFSFADKEAQKSLNYTNKKNYFNVLPNLRFEWNGGNGTSFNINYRSRINSPSLRQLQQSLNTSSAYYSTGNSLLDQAFTHNVNLRFIHSNMEKATNLMLFVGMNATQDYMGNITITNYDSKYNPAKKDEYMGVPITELEYFHQSDEDLKSFSGINLPYGSSVSRPMNIGNQFSMYGGLTYGFPFDLLRSNVNVSLNGNLSSTPSWAMYYTNKEGAEDKYERHLSEVRQRGLTPSLSVTSNISADLDFSLSYMPSYSRVIDEENSMNNSEYFDHNATFNLKWTFWRGFTTEQTVKYVFTDGGSLSKDRNETVWNMSFGKKFLKANKAEIKLQVFDVLGQATGFTRSVNDNTISMNYQNFMPRYFLVTFTYKIANYKNSSSKSSSKKAQQQDMGPGFPGGGFPGGGRGFGGGGFGGGRF